MSKYLLIESRDPFESQDSRAFYDLAASLARDANEVTLFLVQNGVLGARAGEHARWYVELGKAGVEVLADDFSLRERGIQDARLAPGVKASSLDVVVDQLGEGRKTLWH
jgi:sulfur relay (sulfurtransferase) complex TusBCD TusD component (DsrE family)